MIEEKIRYAIYCVSKNGVKKAKEIKSILTDSDIYCIEKFSEEGFFTIKNGLKNLIAKSFNEYDVHIFVMAAGIVVRVIAPYIKTKDIDPAVLVMDEMGKNIISLLSGHLGGANEQCKKISRITNSNPIITTASDVGNKIAVDTISQKLNSELNDLESAKKVTSLIVSGEKVEIVIPKNMYTNNNNKNMTGAVIISNRENFVISKIIPKNIVIGIGCRKNTEKNEIIEAVKSAMSDNNLNLKSIKFFASAWVKKDEKGLLEAVKEFKKKIIFFDKNKINELKDIEFKESEFVKKQIGVGAVSEPCAYLASSKQGKFIAKKLKYKGITISIYEEEFCNV